MPLTIELSDETLELVKQRHGPRQDYLNSLILIALDDAIDLAKGSPVSHGPYPVDEPIVFDFNNRTVTPSNPTFTSRAAATYPSSPPGK